METTTSTNLAKQRTRAAAERTLLAWIRSTLTLLGLGIVISHLSESSVQKIPEISRNIDLKELQAIGLLSIALALVLLALAMWQYIAAVQVLRRSDYTSLSARPLEVAATTAILIYGLIAICALFF